ncbi:hypothetical protein [Dolichospermum circinale]|nr:hypothetical protein [Dolichospermum circinale]MDB9465516.1 hypothetical protein [Dolichospermum circinale CS-539/09]MDB9472654.1 hypothetical protein [Dolichospermum circinale CS-539]
MPINRQKTYRYEVGVNKNPNPRSPNLQAIANCCRKHRTTFYVHSLKPL